MKGLRFLIVGDWGRGGEAGQRAVARAMGQVARRQRIAFVLSVGDNFYDDGVQDIFDPLWQQAFEEVYTASSLQVPWYAVLGNHDHRGSAQAQVAYARYSPRWHLPWPQYTMRHPVPDGSSAEFFCLDTTPLVDDEIATPAHAAHQLSWLRRELERSSAAWKIVVGHHPVRSASTFHGGSAFLQRHLEPLLRSYGCSFYLCGHDHDLQHLRQAGVHYVVSGAGATCREAARTAWSRFAHGGLGFAMMTLGSRTARLAFYDDRARCLYEADVEHASTIAQAAEAA